MKVLIIGLGSIAQKHIAALREIKKNIKIFALRRNKESKKVDGISEIYDLKEIGSIKPDFCIISNPTSVHYESINAISKYGIPLFIEKPLFSKIGIKEQELISRLNVNNQITYVACNLRFLDCLGEMKKILKNKIVNEVNSYCGSYLPDWRPDQDFRKNYSSQANLGGGVHLDLIHELDYVYWLFGKPIHSQKNLRSNSNLDIDSIDYANYLLFYQGFCANIVLNYYRRTPKRQLEIVCAEGTYCVDLLKNNIIFQEEEIFSSAKPITDTYKDQMSYFIDNILTGKDKFNEVEEAYEILRLCIED